LSLASVVSVVKSLASTSEVNPLALAVKPFASEAKPLASVVKSLDLASKVKPLALASNV